MPKSSLEKYISEFLVYTEIEKQRSLNTVENYAFYLNRFLTFAKNKQVTDVARINQKLIQNYRLYLNRLEGSDGEALKKSTQNYHLIALRAFLKYLAKRDIKSLAAEKVELGKTPQRIVTFLEPHEIVKLLDAPLHTEKDLIIKKRDKAILETLFSTGLRVSELARLEKDHINLKKEEFTIRGKGSKPRIVFLSERARKALKTYLEMRTDFQPFLFVRHDPAKKDQDEAQTSLTPRSIQRIIATYAKQIGLTKPVTPHTMRHSYATDLLSNGADIRSVQTLLGHANISTTQVYTHVTNKQLKEVYDKFHDKKRK